MVNCVGFMIYEEDLALGPRTRVDDSRAQELKSFCVAEFHFSDIDIRRETENAPLSSLRKTSYILFQLGITINQKNVSRL